MAIHQFFNHDGRKPHADSAAGFSLIELLFATMVMTVGGLGAYGVLLMAIAANSRSFHESSMTMLTNAVIEQVNSTLVGAGTATLSDCEGNNYTIATAPGGAPVTGGAGSDIDYGAATVANYHMDYVVTTPCAGVQASGIYDVRWHVDQIGSAAGTPSNSFLVTVAAKRKGLSLPMNVQVVTGRPE
jgi:hypothetical protein